MTQFVPWFFHIILFRPTLFGDNFGNSASILTILSLLQAEIMARKSEVIHPTHLYCVTTLPSKTNTTANIGDNS